MSGHGLVIQLSKQWKEEIALASLDQEKINDLIESKGRNWLDVCGYGQKTKWDDGKDFLYNPRDIRVTWGDWGPEHITVPGNACGLDIDYFPGGFVDGMSLNPHNVDSMSQAYLLLIVFTNIAEYIVLDINIRSRKL